MANDADVVYRVYGSATTVKKIEDILGEGGLSLREAVERLGYVQPAVTEEIAKGIRLFDDSTPTGGTSHNDEHLDEFMEELQIPYGTPLEQVNKGLVECGILPVKTDHFCMRGIIYYAEADEDLTSVDICSCDAWSEQQDFITILYEIFKDDPDFSVAFRCEEPGCDYYVSNVQGALYGEYVSDLDCETENFETFEDLCEYVRYWLGRHCAIDDFPTWKTFEELKDWLDQFSEKSEYNKYYTVHKFSIIQ